MGSLGIAVVGAGAIGRRHVELVRRQPGLHLRALVDPAPQAAAIAAALGVPWHASIGELMAHGARPDGVILATPNDLHVAGALECLRHRVPALVEKPVAESVQAADRLVAACADSTTPILVGHHRRHGAALQAAREMIVAGRLGRIVAVSGCALFHKPDAYFDAAWRRETGPLMINMVHEIDTLRYLCGEIVAVQATTSNAVRGFAAEDTAAITLRFAGGALGSFVLSDTAAAPRSWEQTSGENRDYAQHPDQDCLFIAGTEGSLALPSARWWRYGGERSWFVPFESGQVALPDHDPLARQLAHFGEVIERRAAPLVSVADAACNLRVLAAIAEAAREGRTCQPMETV